MRGLLLLVGIILLASCNHTNDKSNVAAAKNSCEALYSPGIDRDQCNFVKQIADICASDALKSSLGDNFDFDSEVKFDITQLLKKNIDIKIGGDVNIRTGLREILAKYGEGANKFIAGYHPCVVELIKDAPVRRTSFNCPVGYTRDGNGFTCTASGSACSECPAEFELTCGTYTGGSGAFQRCKLPAGWTPVRSEYFGVSPLTTAPGEVLCYAHGSTLQCGDSGRRGLTSGNVRWLSTITK